MVTAKLLLVKLKFLLKSGELINHLLLRISKLFDDYTCFRLLLSYSKFEVLSLGFKDLSKLNLFISKLINLFLKIIDSFLKLLLLLSNFSKNGAIKLLVPHLIHTADIGSFVPSLRMRSSWRSPELWRVNWGFVHAKS